MAKQAAASTRLPRGTKPVAQAFLNALDALPEQSQAAVSKAALSMIRDEIKGRREKQRASAASAKTARGAKAGRRPRATKRDRPEAGADTAAAETASKS